MKGVWKMMRPRLVIFLCAAFFAGMLPAAFTQQDPLADFTERINDYLAIQKKAVASVPAPKTSDDPALIVNTQEAIATAIRKARPKAAQGDVFIPSVRPVLLNLIKVKVEGHNGDAIRSTILGEGNPKSPESATPIKLAVNATYSTTAPMSTVPPSLLMAMPTLPEGIEFRFVGRNLILRDTKANLIVDILPDAVAVK